MDTSELSAILCQLREEDAEERERMEHQQAEARGEVMFEPLAVDGSFDPLHLPKRQWLAMGLLLLEHITLLISPGGVGKSTFAMMFAVAVAMGRKDMIPGRDVYRSANVLVINSEDDMTEMKRRLAGILQAHDIDPADLDGKLFIESRYGRSSRLAASGEANEVNDGELYEPLVEFCVENQIEFIVIDPLVGFHNVDENDNGAMEEVAAALRRVAQQTRAAVLTVHHTRKGRHSEDHAGDMNAGRGASSLAAAARIAITLTPMSKDKSEKLKIDWNIGKHLRRIDDAKQNYAPPAEVGEWFEMRDTQIANGERVGVPMPFEITHYEERLEEEKERERERADQQKQQETARWIVGDGTSGKISQPELIKRYMNEHGGSRSAVSDKFKTLPTGEEDALTFGNDDGKTMLIWRNQVGTDGQPRYEIEWKLSEMNTASAFMSDTSDLEGVPDSRT